MHGLKHLSLGLTLLGAVVTAAPAPQGHLSGSTSSPPGSPALHVARQANKNATAPAAPAAGGGGISEAQMRNAVLSWMKNTGKVSNFMNTATSLTGEEYTRQATIALNAEVDELNHKKVLDAGLGNMPEVKAANEVLDTQGSFQSVVDVLQNMVNSGPDTAQADVDAINNNRCVNVLPNIDAYFAAAGMPDAKAIRPTGCLEVQNAPTNVPPPPFNPNQPADPNAAPAGQKPPPANGKNNGNNANNATPTKPPGGGAGAPSSPVPTSTSSAPGGKAAAVTTSSSPARPTGARN